MEVLQQKQVPCLKITETGVTGLLKENWDALVETEGGAVKSLSNPGGSFGIGKTALFALSALRTVIYSTQYVNLKEGGRVAKTAGKVRLVTHPDPTNGYEMTQHIGFWRKPKRVPLKGKEVPKVFRLSENFSTAFFVMGWEPEATWQEQIVNAAAENFFAAIHNRDLVVETRPLNGEGTVVDYQTLGQLFPERNPRRRFYDTLISTKPVTHTIPSPTPDGLPGGVETDVRLTIHQHGQGRSGLAVINRRGMLITDRTDQTSNPFRVQGSTGWPPFTILIQPSSDVSDQWLRKLENPAHNGYEIERVCPPNSLRKIRDMFLDYRRSLKTLITRRLGANKTEVVNVESLRHLLPDVGPSDNGSDRAVITSTLRPPNYRNPDILSPITEIEPEEDNFGYEETDYETDLDDPQPPPGLPPGDSDGPGDQLSEDTGIADTHRSAVLRSPRVLAASGSEIVVTFGVEPGTDNYATLLVRPQGEKNLRERWLCILDADVIDDEGAVESVIAVDGKILIAIVPDITERRRVAMKVTVDKESADIMSFAPAYMVEST